MAGLGRWRRNVLKLPVVRVGLPWDTPDCQTVTFRWDGRQDAVVTGDPRIRPATRSDAPAVRATAHASWHAAYDDVLGPETVERVVDEWYGVASLRTAVAESVFHVAAVDGAVVGFVNAGPNPEYDEGTAELYRIYVHPDRWGEGIGGRLLAAVEDDLGAEGYDRLRLSVLAENAVGVGFYEGHGFEHVETGTVDLGDESYVDRDYLKPL
jgi:ribosomal protein S18 acetylase RimI-like enzyme